jgi:hypothetical protein
VKNPDLVRRIIVAPLFGGLARASASRPLHTGRRRGMSGALETHLSIYTSSESAETNRLNAAAEEIWTTGPTNHFSGEQISQRAAVSSLTSSRDASLPAGFGEGRAGEDLPRDSDQSPLVQPIAGERDSEQSLLDQHLIEVIFLRRTSHPRGFGERKIRSVAPPKITRSPVNDHEKQAVVIETDALGRDRKIEQSLTDEIVEILRVEVVLPHE